MADVWANSMACHPRAICHTAGCCHLANSMSWFHSYVSHCRVLPSGEFSGMTPQSHISHCRVLPLGEFTVTIPEPHATLQGAVTWRNHCHDHATLQGVRILSAILKIVFRHILFFCIKNKQEVKVIWQKAPHGGPIPRLGVTPGGRKLYHWIPGVGFPISVP